MSLRVVLPFRPTLQVVILILLRHFKPILDVRVLAYSPAGTVGRVQTEKHKENMEHL